MYNITINDYEENQTVIEAKDFILIYYDQDGKSTVKSTLNTQKVTEVVQSFLLTNMSKLMGNKK